MVAGEVSGDILGAGLIKAIQSVHPDAEFYGIGGDEMIESGFNSLYPMEELSVMGLVEVLGRLKRLLAIRKSLTKEIIESRPDVFVGIDAPDFNLGLELKLKQSGIKTIHYVSPSVWAWRQKRIFKIAAATNNVLALLPFEKAFYDKHQVPCTFVGHTLADEIPLDIDRQQAKKELFGERFSNSHIIAVLPGSRGSEVSLLTEPFVKACKLLSDQHTNLVFAVPFVNDKRKQQFDQIRKEVGVKVHLEYLDKQSRALLSCADAVIMSSGTATLEAMLCRAPMVVCYKFKWLSYQIFKRIVKIAHFSLPNLLADKPLVKELLQEQVTPENIAQEVNKILENSGEELRGSFADLHKMIRLDASKKAADAVLTLIEKE